MKSSARRHSPLFVSLFALASLLPSSAGAAVILGSRDDGFTPVVISTVAPIVVFSQDIPMLGDVVQIWFENAESEVVSITSQLHTFSFTLSTIHPLLFQTGDALTGGSSGPGFVNYLEEFGQGPGQSLASTDVRYFGLFLGANKGWIGFTYDDAGDSLTIIDYAYTTAGESDFVAGTVPETSSVLLAFCGLIPLLSVRRRPEGV